MRFSFVTYPVRRTSLPTVRRKGGKGVSKMLNKLNAASNRLARARGR